MFGIVSLTYDIIPGYKEAKLDTRNRVMDPLGLIGSFCRCDHNSVLKPPRHDNLAIPKNFTVKRDVHNALYHVHCEGIFVSRGISV